MNLLDILNHLYQPEFAESLKAQKDTLQFLYDALTILDRKAAALMTFDGILIAAAAFAVEKGGIIQTHKVLRSSVVSIIVLSLIAAALCLVIARIGYPFLHFVIQNPDKSLDFTKEFAGLSSAVTQRTYYYQLAWLLSIVAVGLAVLVALGGWYLRLADEPAVAPTRRRRRR